MQISAVTVSRSQKSFFEVLTTIAHLSAVHFLGQFLASHKHRFFHLNEIFIVFFLQIQPKTKEYANLKMCRSSVLVMVFQIYLHFGPDLVFLVFKSCFVAVHHFFLNSKY